MRFLFKNTAGFSLVQGLIIAGIVAGSSLIMTRLLNDQKKAQKTSEVKDKLDEFHQNLFSILQQRQNCKQTITSNGLQLAIINNLGSISIPAIYSYENSTASTVVTSGLKYMNESFKILGMTLSSPVGGTRNLVINYEKLNKTSTQAGKRAYGGNKISKTITLRIQKKNNSTNDFEGCYALVTAASAINGQSSSEQGNDVTKQMCNEMVTGSGQRIFTWDENRSLCLPNAKCPYGQIYTGIDTAGNVKCRNIQDWMDFNQVLNSNATNCPLNARVGFVIDTIGTEKLVRISCGCTTSCDCPNSFDVCEFGTCVNRSTGCINGTYNRGDSICQGYCMGGNWVCPAITPRPVCP